MIEALALTLGAFVVGLSKGGLAAAAAVVVPALALVMNPVQAAALLLPVFLVTDWVAVWLYRRDFSGRNLAILVPSMMLGTALAMLAVPHAPEGALLVVTGAIGLWHCVRGWLQPRDAPATDAAIAPGLFWGTLTGITSFLTHSGSPPAQAYLMPQRLPKLEFAGTIAIAFAIGNLVKLPAYWAIGALGELEPDLFALLAAAGIAGTVAGRRLVARLPERTYRQVIETILLGLSVLLVVRGAAGLV